MRKMKKYHQFIKEDVESDLSTEETKNQFSDMKSEIDEMIEKSLKTSDLKTKEDFIKSYNKNPDESQIEGLINDSDVYDFYLKWRNDIDEMLSKINFYDEIPSEIGSFSLYDYVIKGTKKAVLETIKDLESSKSTD